jgi:hypothetical protein
MINKDFIKAKNEKLHIMKEVFKPSITFRIIAGLFILVGMASFAWGFYTDPQRTWANYLLNNYYFLSLSLGGTFFFVIQYISQSGWSAAFKRVPEAMMAYLPVAAIFFLLMYFGIHNLYHWSHDDAVSHDALLQHKAPYLNVSFFYLRTIIYFSLWILLATILRRYSKKEDEIGGMEYFYKSEKYSKIFVFILAFTFMLSAVDWLMSLEPHWYSTIFALKNMVSAFLHGVSILVLIVLILRRQGYFPFLNKFHLHDFTRYIFMLAIVWGYFWFSQFMLIWYGNIPEETSYFVLRWTDGWKTLFFAEIIINWAVPFFVLLPIKASRNSTVIAIVAIILIAGQYIEQYLHIIPEVTGKLQFGILEVGTFIGYAGLFALVVALALSRAKIIPENHPYIDESKEHHF